MSRLTVSEARPFIAAAAGLCESDSRVVRYLNRSIRRLLPRGKWVGCVQRYRVCTNSDCITWPRAIETIEAFAIEGKPHSVRNEWFEFLESGMGILNQNSNNGNQLVDRGDGYAAFDDITAGSWGYIRLYTDLPESSGKTIILQGYDENANWIRSLDGSAYIDGVKVTLPTSPGFVTTTQKFSRLLRVIKPVTNGAVRLYEYSGTANVRSLAIYEPDEKLPSYRRSYVPGLRNIHTGSDCAKASVEIMAKLRYADAINENDFLLISCLPALEEQTRASVHFENRRFEEGYTCERYAISLLNEQLDSHQGSGQIPQMRVLPNVGAAEITNLVGGGW